jgi:hypothetical protein
MSRMPGPKGPYRSPTFACKSNGHLIIPANLSQQELYLGSSQPFEVVQSIAQFTSTSTIPAH